MAEAPRIYKAKGKNGKKDRLFIMVNGKPKYIKVDDPNMSEKEIIEFIKTNYKIKKKPKKLKKTKRTRKAAKPKKQPTVTPPQPKTGPPSKVRSVLPSVLPSALPIRPSFPASVSVPSVSTTTTKQDIPEVTNLLSELRTYKDSDKKRQEENKRLELANAQLLLENRRTQAETARLKLEQDDQNKQAQQRYEKTMKKLAEAENKVKKAMADLGLSEREIKERVKQLETVSKNPKQQQNNN